MACPFVRVDSNALAKQHTVDYIEDELNDAPGDALTLSNLNSAIQLLTGPSNDDIHLALMSMIEKLGGRYPELNKFKSDQKTVSSFPHYDYLADIQDSLASLDEASACDILIMLGEELISVCCNGIVERAFRCMGGDLQEFLESLDGVYDVLKLQEEDLSDTGFICADEGELIFSTERQVIAWLLLGSLQALSKILYNTEPSITMEPIDGDLQRYRYLFVKSEDSNELVRKTSEVFGEQVAGVDLGMDNSTFCKAFPWHFIMDESLELLQIGDGFGRIFKNYMSTSGKSATTYFRFKRPQGLTLQFREIVRRTNTPFLISLRAPVGRPEFFAKGLEIKGQMVHCPESNTLLFVGSPFLDGLEGLTCNGLFISDIPLHDATREVILVGEQSRAQDGLRRRMDKLKNSIEEGNIAVSKERKKNVSLLQLIFPEDIAERLWLGDEIDAKTYANVTMLFSDIVGFTSICSTATPFMVISMLESLYKVFDELCGLFDVYKVETIGDAYCVAAGLHRPSVYDAHKVTWMAMRMIETCALHNTHDGQHIKMRIGLHTGTVLAGVVGRKMPRYCLFGHQVSIANKFESGSEVCRINISPTTKEWLTKHPGYEFEMSPRDPSCLPKEYPAQPGETCYFLDDFKYSHMDDTLPEKTHIDQAMQQITRELQK